MFRVGISGCRGVCRQTPAKRTDQPSLKLLMDDCGCSSSSVWVVSVVTLLLQLDDSLLLPPVANFTFLDDLCRYKHTTSAG